MKYWNINSKRKKYLVERNLRKKLFGAWESNESIVFENITEITRNITLKAGAWRLEEK